LGAGPFFSDLPIMDQARLYELARKWTNGTITAPEQDELFSAYERTAEGEEAILLPEGFATDQAAHGARLLAAIRAKRTMEQEDQQEVPVMRPRRSWYRYVAAAAVIAGISLVVVWYTSRTPAGELTGQQGTRPTPTIVPGRETAVLTLADGTTITLDSASHGALARQGNMQITQLSGGQITYKAHGEADGQVLMNTMRTPKGGRYRVVLPDGTKAWLNAASAITYPVVFTASTRQVHIEGEVYLEIARDKTKPFIARVNQQSVIEVLGTSFNVHAYPDEGDIRTTLLEGGIKVKNGTGDQGTVLRPGQQSRQENGQATTVSATVDIEQVMAWKNGYFHFAGATVEAVMRQIERWYDVTVVYEGQPPTDRLMGEMPMEAPIDRVLNILGGVGVHFRVEGKVITVTR
jgi:transmembrane sensor